MGKKDDKSATSDRHTAKAGKGDLSKAEKKKLATKTSDKAAKKQAQGEKERAAVARTAAKTTAKKSAAKAKSTKQSAAPAVEPTAKKAAKKTAPKDFLNKHQTSTFTEALRAGEGFDLAGLDAGSTPGFDGEEKHGLKLMKKAAPELADLQERLYASQRIPGGRSVLLIVQGMDTSGKGGIMRHVVGSFDPQGVELTSFKAPTKEEQQHPFLWRIRHALPKPGYIGVFDRSQYEDVLVVRVHDLVARPVWMRRYGQINAFEESTVAKNTTIIKVMLHISADEQKARLMERLDNPEKFYKFNPGDLKERAYWAEYQEAYQAVLDKTSTDIAPWFVVPADNKWYARLAVQQLLLEHLRALDLEWPEPTFNVAEQKATLEKL